MKNPGTKTGKKHKFTMGMAVLYFLLTALVFICLYPFLNVLAYSLSGYNAVLSGDVTFYPIEFTWMPINRYWEEHRYGLP